MNEFQGGILPVDLENSLDLHYLQQFIEGNDDVILDETQDLIAKSGGRSVENDLFFRGHPRGPATDSYYGGDTSLDMDYLYDPFGYWGPSDFWLMDQIEIVGQRLPPIANFRYIPVSLWEYNALSGGGSNTDIPCGTGGSGGQQVDWNFIRVSEGYKDHGYIPYNNDGTIAGNSGITIASGFDLGQHSAADIDQIGLPATTAAALKGYVGLKGYTAEAYLYTHPTVYITPAEGALINSWAHSETLIRTAAAFDNGTSPGAFYQLPPQVQTAIADAAFQFGSLAYTKNADMKSFWNHVIAKDWSSAINDLETAARKGYAERRAREADLIRSALNNGEIHDGALC